MLMKNRIKKEDYPLLYDCALKLYEKSRSDNLKNFPMSERRKYYINGNRNDFEKLYFNRRDYLSATAILALFDEEYIPELEKIMLAVCEEYCWALPAHTVGIKIADKKIIDLFVAETGFVLSEICTVFSDSLSEKLILRVKAEIKKRVVNNYVRYRYWWEKCEMNWASVCGAYVGGTLLYLFPEVFQKHKSRILKTLECYIKGFSDDGFCLEGPLYWQYGFTAYTVFADLLYRYSDGKEDLFAHEKVKKIACYGVNCLLKGNTALSFSDADRSFRPDYALQHFLHIKIPDKVSLPPADKLCFYDANTKWMNYYRAVLWSHSSAQSDSLRKEEIYSPSSHQLIINKPTFSFAIKGGDNDEPHNHNDLGSFIYSDKDSQVFCDLGSGRYTKDYFDDKKRYDILCNSSLGHSVPIIDGKAQGYGKEFHAPLFYKNACALCNMTKAYSCEELISLERKIDFYENSVHITDSFSFTRSIPVTERFVSLRKAELKDGELIFGATKLKYPSKSAVLKISEEKHTPHEYDTEDITVYCYDFILKGSINEITFEIKTEEN